MPSFKDVIKNLSNKDFLFNILVYFGLTKRLSDEKFLKIKYRICLGKDLNLEKPKLFTEKLQWLKLYNRNPEYIKMVDKILAKEYVQNVLGSDCIIKNLGVWNNTDEINRDILPKRFVIKTNNGSGSGCICLCKDRDQFNKDICIKKMDYALTYDVYKYYKEWPYKNVVPKIFAEEYIESPDGDLKDYKFFCFNGKVKCFKVDYGRFTEHHANYFDVNKTLLPFGESDFSPIFSKKIVLPNTIDIMIKYAEKLSKNMPFVRIDFYDVNGKIYFGEMTFFPASGFGKFTDDTWDQKLGSWIRLPNKFNN